MAPSPNTRRSLTSASDDTFSVIQIDPRAIEQIQRQAIQLAGAGLAPNKPLECNRRFSLGRFAADQVPAVAGDRDSSGSVGARRLDYRVGKSKRGSRRAISLNDCIRHVLHTESAISCNPSLRTLPVEVALGFVDAS